MRPTVTGETGHTGLEAAGLPDVACCRIIVSIVEPEPSLFNKGRQRGESCAGAVAEKSSSPTEVAVPGETGAAGFVLAPTD